MNKKFSGNLSTIKLQSPLKKSVFAKYCSLKFFTNTSNSESSLLFTNSSINLKALNNSPPLVTSSFDAIIDSIKVVPDLGVPSMKIFFDPILLSVEKLLISFLYC